MVAGSASNMCQEGLGVTLAIRLKAAKQLTINEGQPPETLRHLNWQHAVVLCLVHFHLPNTRATQPVALLPLAGIGNVPDYRFFGG